MPKYQCQHSIRFTFLIFFYSISNLFNILMIFHIFLNDIFNQKFKDNFKFIFINTHIKTIEKTPLFLAVDNANIELVKLLLEVPTIDPNILCILNIEFFFIPFQKIIFNFVLLKNIIFNEISKDFFLIQFLKADFFNSIPKIFIF